MGFIERNSNKAATIFNYKSHDDPILRNILYSSIIKCIKSKLNSIQDISITLYR